MRAGGPQQGKLSFDQQLLTMRLIIGALAMGLLVFGVVVNVVLGPADPPNDDALRMFVWGALCVGLVALVLNRVVGSMVAGGAAKHLPADEEAAKQQVIAGHQAGLIVSAAILEGAAFFCLIVYAFLAGDRMLVMMAGLLWMSILIKFPFANGVIAQVDNRLRLARENRQLGG